MGGGRRVLLRATCIFVCLNARSALTADPNGGGGGGAAGGGEKGAGALLLLPLP